MNKGKITISRPNYSDGKEVIQISISDDDAVVKFLTVEIGLEDFTKALTGQSRMPVEFEINALDCVGKKRETKCIEFKISDKSMYKGRSELAIKEAKKHTPDGWIADEYYGSQRSFFYKFEHEQWARTTIYRWVTE